MIKSSSRVEILAQVRKFREDAAANFVQWKRCHEKLKSALRDKRFGVASHCREIVSCIIGAPLLLIVCSFFPVYYHNAIYSEVTLQFFFKS